MNENHFFFVNLKYINLKRKSSVLSSDFFTKIKSPFDFQQYFFLIREIYTWHLQSQNYKYK